MPQDNKISIAVLPENADQHDRAASLAAKLDIPFTTGNPAAFRFLLICAADSLYLQQTAQGKIGPITASFADPAMLYRLKHGTDRRQHLARAVGLKKNWQPEVIDATGGLGRDGFVLAYLGCRVHMLERSPILAAMIEDGLARARLIPPTSEAAGRIRLTRTDSLAFLQKLPESSFPDVIYIDPMYPERTKSSLVKKEMRILRELVGDDLDAPELLETALRLARNRVVVKRPRLAPILGCLTPSHTITGKTSRFDVYLV